MLCRQHYGPATLLCKSQSLVLCGIMEEICFGQLISLYFLYLIMNQRSNDALWKRFFPSNGSAGTSNHPSVITWPRAYVLEPVHPMRIAHLCGLTDYLNDVKI